MNLKPLTVTALNKYLKYCFDHDENLVNVLLKGEISNYKQHSSGHVYFTLKDESSQISAVMFHKHARELKIACENGMNVIVEGYVGLYIQGGTYQIYVTKIIIDGLGELYLRFEKLKKQLSIAGLFSEQHKLPLPKYPEKIGVVTSTTGAAIKDIITTIERRFPLCEIIVFPTSVQGENAKSEIVKAITKANNYPELDLIILGRGGGSIEDLWSFNEGEVAYAIYEAKIPIISAVGHETDYTISDYVSDLRAATPTAAGELAVPNKNDILHNLNQIKYRLAQFMSNILKINYQLLNKLKNSYVFINPYRIYEQNYLVLDKHFAILEKNNPLTIIDKNKQRLFTNYHKLNFVFEKKYRHLFNNFEQLVNKLNFVNPLSLLDKGYTIIKKENKLISSITELEINDLIKINFKDGMITSEVKNKEEKTYERNEL